MKHLLAITPIIALLTFTFPAHAAPTAAMNQAPAIVSPSIRIFNLQTLMLENEFVIGDDTGSMSGISISACDVTGDGNDELILGSGKNEKPMVRIMDAQGTTLSSFLAFPEEMTTGIAVTAANVTGDAQCDILVTPLHSGSPELRVYSTTGELLTSFFVFDEKNDGGSHIAAGDVNGDGLEEIIAGSGAKMKASIRIYSYAGKLLREWQPYTGNVEVGVSVADMDGNGTNEIVASPLSLYTPLVKWYSYDGEELGSLTAYHPGFGGGVYTDTYVDPVSNKTILITGAGFSGSAHVRFLDNNGTSIQSPPFFAFSDFKGGVIPTVLQTKSGKILAVATAHIPHTPFTAMAKMIDVNISQQKLYTYEYGDLLKEYLISSGVRKHPTPVGNFSVTRKRLSTTMSWVYGVNHPDNYNLPGVPYILSFKGPYTIHGTYWHNNFGRPMSHGCVNMSIPDSKVVYEWAEIGTPVSIHY